MVSSREHELKEESVLSDLVSTCFEIQGVFMST